MKAKRILKKLNYLPRWAWYLASLSVGGPIGPLFVYLGFHVLEKMAKDETEDEARGAYDWDVDIDDEGIHVHRTGAGSAKKDKRAASAYYQDEECVVTGEEDFNVQSEWARTEESARQARYETADTGASAEESAAGSLEDVTREVSDAIRRIRTANDLIPDPELSAQIDSIESSCSQILSILRQRPQLLTELRTFLRYYLPTTLKLLDARARLENANTPKGREVRTRISEALGVIDTAFKKQLEALDEYRFIDLESEMDVLRDMLRADGLVEDETEHTGTPLAGH